MADTPTTAMITGESGTGKELVARALHEHSSSQGQAVHQGNMPEGLRELYIDELKDLYSAENQLVKALPKMAKAAAAAELRQGFEKHLKQTQGQVQRLEKIFQALGESPKGKKCKGMEGLIEEGSEAMEEDYEGSVMDAALIGAAQRVEHYEIAGYGTVRTWLRRWAKMITFRSLSKHWKRRRKPTRN